MFVYDAGLLKEVGMAHEFGHRVGNLDHNYGPYPGADGALPLMRSGFDANCGYQEIGKWLSKDEWKKMSDEAQDYED